jgi:pimeloyl-ACP methyl ester carboxylesterase
MDTPVTRYAHNGDVHIAYQSFGSGPDLILIPGIFANLDRQWEEPGYAAFLERLGSFARLTVLDARGSGLSDRAEILPQPEEQMDDITAVMSAVGIERATIAGFSQGGQFALLYAATYPSRVDGLILYAAYASARRQDDYPWGRSDAWTAEWQRILDEDWGTGATLPLVAPTRTDDPRFRAWWTRFERSANSPAGAIAFARVYGFLDVRHLLSAISVPTLVLQRRTDVYRASGQAAWIADRIAGAALVELDGVDHLPYVGDWEAITDEIASFIHGSTRTRETDRVLATVMFTDIAGSTEMAAAVGDRRWRETVERHNDIVRRALDRYRGREVDTAGDGFFATFDGPARAVRCAGSIRDAVVDLGLAVRIGLHTGEVENAGTEVRGLAVNIGSRAMATAAAGEIVATGTVRDLVVGSGITFADRGRHGLKGVPGDWQLFTVGFGPAA